MANEPIKPPKDSGKLRQQIIDTCFLMRDRLGYFIGTWGNISVRVKEGLILTPSRMSYEQVTRDDLVVISMEGDVIKGGRLPTSEMQLHLQVMLERPDIGAIIHSHSAYASAVACARQSIPVILDDMAEVIGGQVNCAEYAPAGNHKKLAENVRKAIGKEANAVLLANHGVIAGGRDLDEAIIAAQFVEKAAMILIQAQALGGVVPIDDKLWREERDRYLYKYGRAEDFEEILKIDKKK